MSGTEGNALDALERARRAQEEHDRRVDVQLRLACTCLEYGHGLNLTTVLTPTCPIHRKDPNDA